MQLFLDRNREGADQKKTERENLEKGTGAILDGSCG